jgi:hypothetical protein
MLVLDNGPCHTSTATQWASAARHAWLEVLPSRYLPHRDPEEHEWRRLKRDLHSHLTGFLRAFVDEVVAGLHILGGASCSIVNEVLQWRQEGHRQEPTGRPPGRPKRGQGLRHGACAVA